MDKGLVKKYKRPGGGGGGGGSFDFQRPMAWVMLFSTGIGTLLKNLFLIIEGLILLK